MSEKMKEDLDQKLMERNPDLWARKTMFDIDRKREDAKAQEDRYVEMKLESIEKQLTIMAKVITTQNEVLRIIEGNMRANTEFIKTLAKRNKR